jgi:hypothetical protein
LRRDLLVAAFALVFAFTFSTEPKQPLIPSSGSSRGALFLQGRVPARSFDSAWGRTTHDVSPQEARSAHLVQAILGRARSIYVFVFS